MKVNERRTVVGGLIGHCVSPPQPWREIDAHVRKIRIWQGDRKISVRQSQGPPWPKIHLSLSVNLLLILTLTLSLAL